MTLWKDVPYLLIVNIRYYDIGGSAETRGKAEIFYPVLSLATALYYESYTMFLHSHSLRWKHLQ